MNQKKVQLILTGVWFLMFIPALLVWQASVPFLVFVSVYANFVGHLSAWEAARGAEIGFSNEEAGEVLEKVRQDPDQSRGTFE